MIRPHGAFVLPLLAWLLTSFVAAALAHGLIGLLGNAGLGGNAYADHGHAAVAPVALAALMLVTMGLLTSALRGLSRYHRIDPIALLARRFAKTRPLLPSVAVAIGGVATLFGMEFSEQVSAFGQIQGANALGGNVFVGTAIVIAVAASVTIVGLRSARGVLSTAIAAMGALVAWIIAKAISLVDRGAIVRGVQRRRRTSTPAFLARCLRLRAPPLALV